MKVDSLTSVQQYKKQLRFECMFTAFTRALPWTFNSGGNNFRLEVRLTRWTNVNLLYLPGSIEVASLEGLMLWCPEIN